jgi:hypothetical protein
MDAKHGLPYEGETEGEVVPEQVAREDIWA